MIADALHAYGTKNERVWRHDRTKTVGASEIGMCARRIWFSKHDTPHDEQPPSWGYTRRGASYEDHWFVPALKAHYGKRFRYAGEAQKTFIYGPEPDKPILSATPDGLLRDVTPQECAEWGIPETDCVLVECKNIGSYKLALTPKPEHEFQVQVQMGCVRAARRYMPTAAILLYASAFSWSNMAEWAIPFDLDVFHRGIERGFEILEAPSAADVKAEGIESGGNECKRCAYLSTCNRIELKRDLRASAEAA